MGNDVIRKVCVILLLYSLLQEIPDKDSKGGRVCFESYLEDRGREDTTAGAGCSWPLTSMEGGRDKWMLVLSSLYPFY